MYQCVFLVPFVDDVKALYRLLWILPLRVVNVSVVMLLPSNRALMGPNSLPDWLCSRLEYLFVLNGPVSSSGMTDPFTCQCTFVLVASSKMCVCSSVLSVDPQLLWLL